MSADRFLNQVEQAGLLEDAVLARLRSQLASAKTPPTAQALAEGLVKSGQLTRFQATKLLEAIGPAKPPQGSAKTPAPLERPAAPRAAGDDDDLDLVPLDDEEGPAPGPAAPGRGGAAPARRPDAGDDLQLDLGDDEPAPSGSGLKPIAGGLEPISGGLEPISGGLEPISGGLEPIDGGLEPISGGLEPIGGGLEPISGGLEPIESPAALAPAKPGGGRKAPSPAEGLTPVAGSAGLEPVGSEGLQEIQSPQEAGLPPGGRPPLSFHKPSSGGNVWDSKLLLIGGGALVLIIFLGVALYMSMTRGTAAQMLQAADQDYSAEAYSQAIAKYEKFLKQYPQDPNVSLAQVKIGTARMWQALKASSDKTRALETAKRELPQLEQQEAFAQQRAEVAAILPEIAAGFASDARTQRDMQRAQQLVDLADEAMQLVDNPSYVPTSQRKRVEAKLAKIEEDIQLARRNINMSKRLAEAIAAMRTAAEAGDTVEAFRLRHILLNGERDEQGVREVPGYPELTANPELVKATLYITEQERDLVKIADQPVAAETVDHPPASQHRVSLSSQQTQGEAGNARHVFCVLARGAVYGLDAATGKVLWRRFVGHETLISPRAASQQAGADVIAVDSRRQELLRLDGASGALRWRLPVGEPIHEPVLEGRRLLLGTAAGRLLNVDLEKGTSPRQVQLPMRLQVAPGVSPLRRLYQVGEHSNLYVLDDQSFECQEVYYLGHKPGSVLVPPVMALGHLFVAVNGGENFCELHILKADESGGALAPARDPLRLRGRVTTPLLLSGARVVVITDLGALQILEVNPASPKEPVINAVAPVVASFQSPLDSYPVLDGGRLFIGNDRLSRYEIQTSRNQLASQWIQYQRDVFVAPPQVLGGAVYHLRRRKDSPAYTATASESSSGKTLWEVDLAVPPALLNVDMAKKQIDAVSMQAELFEVTADVFQTGVLDKSAAVALGASRSVPFSQAITLDGGRWALASDQDRAKVVIYDPQADSASGRLVMRPLKVAGEAAVTAPPAAFDGGLLIPLDNGQVALADPQTGDHQILPFQAPVDAGTKTVWRWPAVGDDYFVVADQQGKAYRVMVAADPQPHLEAAAQADLGGETTGSLAAAGDTIYAVLRGAASDTVISLAAADLALGSEFPLEGRVVWGPKLAGDAVLVATDRDRLLCFASDQKQRWSVEWTGGPLVGRPLVDDADLLLASSSGAICRLNAQDGSEISRAEIGEPLAAGPVFFGAAPKRMLLLGSSDGTLHLIPAP